MLEKCMVVRATRFVVPSVVGDLPYTNEEMLKVDGFGKDNKNTNYIWSPIRQCDRSTMSTTQDSGWWW